MTVAGAPRVAPHTQTEMVVKIEGQQLGAATANDLLEVRVDVGVRRIGRATLTFRDREANLLDGKLELDKQVEISSVEPAMVVFSGTVTGLELDAGPSGATVTATVQDLAYPLSRNRAVATFQQQSYSDVITTIARKAGLTPDLRSTGAAIEWLLQADSELGLVDEIAGRLGLDWAISDRTLALWPVAETAPWGNAERTLELGLELLTFSVRRADLGPTEFTVRGWDPMKKATVTATATSSTERDGFAPPSGAKTATVLAAHQVSTTTEEVKQVAAGLAAAAGRVEGRGRATFAPELRPGGVAVIKGVGKADGRYYVREVSHLVDAGSLRTVFKVGDRAPVQLTDPWQAPAPFSSLRHTGVTVGVVDNIRDPDQLGRVRVQLVGLAPTVSSHWARVLSLGGGAGHGLVLMPEVDDEVLVAFEEDDVRRPVVIGGLFGKQVKPAGPASVSNGAIVSRHLVSGKGHRIELADGPGASNEHIKLVLADGGDLLRIGKDKSELAAENKQLTISSGGASITFDGRGNVTIDATSLTLKAKQAIKLEGMTITAKANTSLEASSGVKAVLSGSAQTVVKGGIVEISGMPVKIN